MHNYARKFFKDNDVNEYHLRVSPTNRAALKFYPALTGIKTPTSRIKEIEKCRWEINCP
ncbi:hypothetical protein [Lysinibacillus sp. LZ02]|uniref:hypothetical protein n=1 Tax=Lysinibacillus sp. LZ02 TaxID=3420668 RepID=UPI003D35BC41